MKDNILTIEKCPYHHNCYAVRQGEGYQDKLCWDEMLGFVAAFTSPKGEGWGTGVPRLLTMGEHYSRWPGSKYQTCLEEHEETVRLVDLALNRP